MEARARSLAGVGHTSKLEELRRKVLLDAISNPPAPEDYTSLRDGVGAALMHVATQSGAANEEALRLELEAVAEMSAVTAAMRAAEQATPELLAQLAQRTENAQRLSDDARSLRQLHAFALDAADARALLGLYDAPCGNCDTKAVAGATCVACDAFACAACLAVGIDAAGAENFAATCFACSAALDVASVAVALARSQPAHLRKLYEGSARADAFAEHVESLKAAKRLRAAPLGERLASLFTEPLACSLCDTPAVLGADCMHMNCERCKSGMCGWCLEPESVCEAVTCLLNPYGGEGNESQDKNKSMLVLRCYRAAQLLRGVPPAERAAALLAAAPAFAAASDVGVGCVRPDDPWLFREGWGSADDKPYMTSVLRNVLHDAYRGPGGGDAPPFVFRSVSCGDIITLISLAAALEDTIQDTDGADEGVDVAAVYAGRRGIVVLTEADGFCARMSDGAVITADWEAAATLTRFGPLAEAMPRAGIAHSLRAGDLVRISSHAREVCRADELGWHPDMAPLLGAWARVEAKRGNNAFGVRVWGESYTFPAACADHVVREADALAVL